MDTAMIENYENLNREETIEVVSDFDAEKLIDFLEYERENKNRKTVLEPLKRDLVSVRPADMGQQYVAGIWFDEPRTGDVVRRSTRVQRAIEDGDLVVIG